MSEWFADLKADFILNFVQDNRWKFLVTGLRNTLIITFLSVLIGIVLGIIVAIIKNEFSAGTQGVQKEFLYRWEEAL